MASQPTAQQTSSTHVQRYHGLDGLRGFACCLVLSSHATLPYFSRIAGFEFVWPADDDQSVLMFLVFDFIHVWRMPVFFLMAGFFAHLVLDRRSVPAFVLDRLKRISIASSALRNTNGGDHPSYMGLWMARRHFN